MTVDVAALGYDVELVTAGGGRFLLNDALLSLEWGEQKNELAQRATLTLANIEIGGTRVMEITKINCVILISAGCGGGRTRLFEGTIWEWQYVSATQKELSITAYDYLIRLQQSKDFKYYSAGKTTMFLVGDICDSWGIPYSYQWGQYLTHEKKTFSAETISDMIVGLLEEVRQKTGERYIIYWRDGQMQIRDYGTNGDVYRLDTKNTISTSDKLTVNELVTQVKVIGKQEDDGRFSVDAIVKGDMSFGVLQEIIRRDADKSVGAAVAEAEALIEERGKPEEIIKVSAADVPFIRKGDRVEIKAGNLIGFFYAEGVTHQATKRQMTLALSRG